MTLGKRTFLDNRHPDYANCVKDWIFCWQSYVGGEEYRKGKHLFKFSRESQVDYEARVARTARVNYTAQVLDLLVSYLCKEAPTRKETVPETLASFWKNVDGEGTNINDFIKGLAAQLATTGIQYLVVDKPPTPNVSGTVLEREQKGLKPFVYIVSPVDVLDVVHNDANGEILQIIIRETFRPSEIDLEKPRENDNLQERFRVWKKVDNGVEWKLWKKEESKDPEIISKGFLDIERVPILPVIRKKGSKKSKYSGKSLADDFVQLDRAIYNYESLLDQIIYDQTFSTLAVPYESFSQQFYDKWEGIIGTKSCIPFDAKTGAIPQYISPDASQAQLIVDASGKKIQQIYQLSNLLSEVGQATKVAPESGIAKGYEFEKLNAVLCEFADVMELAEEGLASLVLMWSKDSATLPDDAIDYPDKFDTKSIMQELQELLQIEMVQLGKRFEAAIKIQLVKKIAPKLDEKTMNEVIKEIENLPDPNDEKNARDKLNKVA